MAKWKVTIVLSAIACIALASIVSNQARSLTNTQYWEQAQEGQYKSTDELKAQHQAELQRGEIYRKLMRGNPEVKAVALTFDDGPHPAFTPQILAILKKHKIKATFFVVGKMAKKYPYLIKAEAADGNVVGNHTFDHLNLTRIPDKMVPSEWDRCSATIKSILGKAPEFCRPPGGDYNKSVIEAAATAGLTTVLWTDDPADYAKPGDKTIESRVLDRVDNGGIILIHDGVQQTIDVLPRIINTLEKRGFRFETVAEMTKDHPEATPGDHN